MQVSIDDVNLDDLSELARSELLADVLRRMTTYAQPEEAIPVKHLEAIAERQGLRGEHLLERLFSRGLILVDRAGSEVSLSSSGRRFRRMFCRG